MSSEDLTLRDINDRLGHVRKTLGFVTEDELGEALGYSRTQIYKIRTGQSRVTQRFLRALVTLEDTIPPDWPEKQAIGDIRRPYEPDALTAQVTHEVHFIEHYGNDRERNRLRKFVADLYAETTSRIRAKALKEKHAKQKHPRPLG